MRDKGDRVDIIDDEKGDDLKTGGGEEDRPAMHFEAAQRETRRRLACCCKAQQSSPVGDASGRQQCTRLPHPASCVTYTATGLLITPRKVRGCLMIEYQRPWAAAAAVGAHGLEGARRARPALLPLLSTHKKPNEPVCSTHIIAHLTKL